MGLSAHSNHPKVLGVDEDPEDFMISSRKHAHVCARTLARSTRLLTELRRPRRRRRPMPRKQRRRRLTRLLGMRRRSPRRGRRCTLSRTCIPFPTIDRHTHTCTYTYTHTHNERHAYIHPRLTHIYICTHSHEYILSHSTPTAHLALCSTVHAHTHVHTHPISSLPFRVPLTRICTLTTTQRLPGRAAC